MAIEYANLIILIECMTFIQPMTEESWRNTIGKSDKQYIFSYLLDMLHTLFTKKLPTNCSSIEIHLYISFVSIEKKRYLTLPFLRPIA